MKKKKKEKEKYSVLVMRSNGKVKNYTTTGRAKYLLIILTLLFGAAALYFAYAYYNLYLENAELKADLKASISKVAQLDKVDENKENEKEQEKINESFTGLTGANSLAELSSDLEETIKEDNMESEKTLKQLSEQFTEVTESKVFEVENFNIDKTGNFKFTIKNLLPQSIEGALILIFLVENEEKKEFLMPYSPSLDLNKNLNFENGITYSLKASRPVNENAHLKEAVVFKEVLILAQDKEGQIVYNKILALDN